MENKSPYCAPALREWAVRFDIGFLASATGSIDDWIEDDDPINF